MSNGKRCATCRFWRRHGESKLGFCGSVHITKLKDIGFLNEHFVDNPALLLITGLEGNYNFTVGLRTRHDFGCTEYNEKESDA